MKDFLTLKDLAASQWSALIRLSAEVKQHPAHFRQLLLGKSAVMVFEKASLRTRLTFELGMKQLGGDAVYLDYQDSRLQGREPLQDVARNLERWFTCIVARTFAHATVEELARNAGIPVINALTDAEHPCQALADVFTLTEKWGRVEGRRLAYVGDANNVCTSLIHAAALSGMSITVVSPASHRPAAGTEEDFERMRTSPSARFDWSDSMKRVQDADAIYTDTWISMGQEAETEERVETFEPYQVTAGVMERAGPAAYFMHCLPAHRNQEVTDSVIDSSRSLVYEQAENRLHVQKALLLSLLAPREIERYQQLTRWSHPELRS